MTEPETRVCDAGDLTRLLDAMARQINEQRRSAKPLRLVGIRTRGVPIAQRLAHRLQLLGAREIPVGAVDIALHRDDIGQAPHWPILRGTEIPFEVDGAEIVLVDDVLFTGRTVRAALNAVCDLGRPACVRLAVLVDRGHRELPIQPDVLGLHLATERSEHVRVGITPVDQTDEVVRHRSSAVS